MPKLGLPDAFARPNGFRGMLEHGFPAEPFLVPLAGGDPRRLAALPVAGSRAIRLVRPAGVAWRSVAIPAAPSSRARKAAASASSPGGFELSIRR